MLAFINNINNRVAFIYFEPIFHSFAMLVSQFETHNLEMGPEPTLSCFWFTVNKRLTRLWPWYFLTQTWKGFFYPKGRKLKILTFSGGNFPNPNLYRPNQSNKNWPNLGQKCLSRTHHYHNPLPWIEAQGIIYLFWLYMALFKVSGSPGSRVASAGIKYCIDCFTTLRLQFEYIKIVFYIYKTDTTWFRQI